MCKNKLSFWGATLFALCVAMPSAAAVEKKAAIVPDTIPMHSMHNVAAHGYFYAGGKLVGKKGNEGMEGQMYVEVFKPKKITKPYPLVFYHGAAQTGTNWMATADGNKGWAPYFVERGYLVYVVDQPARGRSAYQPDIDGELRIMGASQLEARFTASAYFEQPAAWPQAKKHTQWPGNEATKGRRGDPVFDAFLKTQVPYLSSNLETAKLVQAASAALLDEIGPAILVTHSQSGAFGWLIADARPGLVKGIIALKPQGPPFRNAVFSDSKARAWGITDGPITYDPPVSDPSELQTEEIAPMEAGEVAGILQKTPARQLPNLKGIPILIVAGEASYHDTYDAWTSRFLTQAGVKNTYVQLGKHGIHGNGHMMMLEKNSLDIARFVDTWMAGNIR